MYDQKRLHEIAALPPCSYRLLEYGEPGSFPASGRTGMLAMVYGRSRSAITHSVASRRNKIQRTGRTVRALLEPSSPPGKSDCRVRGARPLEGSSAPHLS